MQSTRYSCQILMKLQFSRHIFEKFSNTKFDGNQSSGGLRDGQTDMTKLIVPFSVLQKQLKMGLKKV